MPYPVYMGYDLWNVTGNFLEPYIMQGNVFFITDKNVRGLCLPVLYEKIHGTVNIPTFTLPPGEEAKELNQLEKIWKWLMKSGASRNSLLVNIGGGAVTDIGGFAAATYHRGMSYINIPTTLMGQADAGVGGKTGININGVKNQAGLFYDPLAVFIIPEFLETLAEAHIRSGFAEIVKCAALSGLESWEQIKNISLTEKEKIFNLACETVRFKCSVVALDPFDRSSRNMLNFGHTAGHGLESFFISKGRKDYLHGDAIAAGMICEAWISFIIAGLPGNELEEITGVINSLFHLETIQQSHYDRVASIMEYDKKKTTGGAGFTLLERIGKPVTGRTVDKEILFKAFDYYNSIVI